MKEEEYEKLRIKVREKQYQDKIVDYCFHKILIKEIEERVAFIKNEIKNSPIEKLEFDILEELIVLQNEKRRVGNELCESQITKEIKLEYEILCQIFSKKVERNDEIENDFLYDIFFSVKQFAGKKLIEIIKSETIDLELGGKK